MKLFVIRHGESLANKERFLASQTDVDLSEKGIQDAEKAREILKEVRFDRVYSSDLRRAVHTAEIALPGASIEKITLAREIDIGSLTGKYFTECAEYGETWTKARENLDFSPFGGECAAEVRKRARTFLEHIEKEDGENIALFTHAWFTRCLLDEVMGMELPRKKYSCRNCSVAVFEFADGEWKLFSWNMGGR